MAREANAKVDAAPVQHGQGPDCMVGTLNLLGDAFNPFEFLPLDDAEFMSQYEVLRDRFQKLTWDDLREAVEEVLKGRPPEEAALVKRLQDASQWLKSHCQSALVWTAFSEEVLKKDNKLLKHRTNLLTMAMKSSGDGLQWHLCAETLKAPWIGLMQSQLGKDTYSVDEKLFLFDVVCNVVASTCINQYKQICVGSYLNPDNHKARMTKYLDVTDSHNSTGLPVVVGFQEFPDEGSQKAAAYERVLNDRNYGLVRGSSSVALVYCGFGSSTPRRLTPDIFDAKDVMLECIEECSGGGSIDEKTRGNFMKTTAAKTLAIELSDLICIVVHAKEPKRPLEASILAKYMRTLASTAQRHCLSSDRQKAWVILSDTNLADDASRESFHIGLLDESFRSATSWVPAPSRPTTVKHRSVLHGQCYDTRKCGKTVVAHKDYIMTSLPSCLHLCRTTPELQMQPDGSVARTLPAPDWGSDHSLVTAVLSSSADNVVWTGFNGVLKVFTSSDAQRTGCIQADELRRLFKQLSIPDDDFSTLMRGHGKVDKEEVNYEEFLLWLFFQKSPPPSMMEIAAANN